MTISLSSMLECLNIFGNAGVASSNPFKKDYGNDDDHHGGGAGRKRRRGDDTEDEGDGNWRGGRRQVDSRGDEKQTSLKLTYKGVGNPLVML